MSTAQGSDPMDALTFVAPRLAAVARPERAGTRGIVLPRLAVLAGDAGTGNGERASPFPRLSALSTLSTVDSAFIASGGDRTGDSGLSEDNRPVDREVRELRDRVASLEERVPKDNADEDPALPF